jgi:hypothetical protein
VSCSAVRGDGRPAGAGRSSLAARTPEVSNEHMGEKPPHQCPFCELRFLYANEVKDHVVVDHPEHADAFIFVEPHELPRG